LKTTLDYKLRPDGTATVWCGMSDYDFHHEPTPKELPEGLADAHPRRDNPILNIAERVQTLSPRLAA